MTSRAERVGPEPTGSGPGPAGSHVGRLHLYCVTPSDSPPPSDLEGVCGGAVSGIALDGLLLWTERCAPPPSPRVEVLRRHNEVVEAACRAGPCLPVRFGTGFTDEGALREAFGDRDGELREGLRRVSGCREFGVMVLGSAGESGTESSVSAAPPGAAPTDGAAEPAAGTSDSSGGPGTAHLRRVAAREERARERARAAEAVSREVEEAVEGLVRAVRWEPLPSGRGVAALAHLVPEEAVPEYRSRIRRWIESRRPLAAVPSGPWPPYSFTP